MDSVKLIYVNIGNFIWGKGGGLGIKVWMTAAGKRLMPHDWSSSVGCLF